jgi:transporter family protein
VTTVGYVVAAIVLASLGQIQLSSNSDLFWAFASAALAIGALILLYVALGSGEASKVVPVSAAYPAVTLVLAAIFLSEGFTLPRAGGVLLVIAGVVVLTSVK